MRLIIYFDLVLSMDEMGCLGFGIKISREYGNYSVVNEKETSVLGNSEYKMKITQHNKMKQIKI